MYGGRGSSLLSSHRRALPSRVLDLYARLILPTVFLAIIAWSLNPFACCPRECLDSNPCMSARAVCLSQEVSSNDSADDICSNSSQLAKADSQLGKTVVTGSPYSHLIVHLHAIGATGVDNHQIILLAEQLQPESAFVLLIKHPPRV